MRAGDPLGPYQLASLLGAGGMGEVFRARDTRLGRDVAVKVLPQNFSADADRLHRFEQEARTLAALNHPNLLVVFDIGTHEGAPYLVSELLEGRTLREEMNAGPLPMRRSLDYALQIAAGLAAAHTRGVVHRDIKPENVFVTNDGRVKILDFGLAKLRQGASDTARARKPTAEATTIVDPDAKTAIHTTEAGVVLGTPAYMSPEQVSGREADYRSDMFSFGAVLYEMISGQRAFRRDTSVETMTAILREEPADLGEINEHLPPGLDRVVRRCLEKRPEQRFQSASDLAFALENLTHFSSSRRILIETGKPGRRWLLPVVIAAAAILPTSLGIILTAKRPAAARAALPEFKQVTFRRGTVVNARFAPDGQSVVYSARWNANPLEIFSSRPGTPEARSLGLTNADVLSISPTGDLALLLDRQPLWWFVGRGTLARLPLAGGAPRPMLDDVQEADWYPNGTNIVVVRWSNGRNRLEEHPGGKVLAETTGYFSHPRVSPGGDWIAYTDHPVAGDNRGTVRVANREGVSRTLTREYPQLEGLAWNPTGTEVWFTSTSTGEAQSLRAADLSGKERLVLNTPVNLMLHDVGRDGQLLLTRQFEMQEILGSLPPEPHERNFTAMDRCQLRGVSPDGSKFLLVFFGEGAGANYSTYLSSADGSPSIRLGEGHGHALSADGKWVFASTYNPPRLIVMPTGAGETRTLNVTNLEPFAASWLPDNRHLVVHGRNGTNGLRYFLLDIEGGEPKAVTPEGVRPPTYFGVPLSPDGRFAIAALDRGERMLYPLDGSPPQPMPALAGYQIAGWAADGKSLFAYERKSPVKVKRYDLAAATLEPLREVFPADLAGSLGEPAVAVTADGKGYVYFNWRLLTDLFVVSGL